MLPTPSDLPPNPLQISQEDKFYTRLLSKESSLASLSFRVYYGMSAGKVPFLWESQPGKPKDFIPHSTLPPLTPPPFHHSNPTTTKKKTLSKRPSHSNFINIILPRLALRKSSPLSSSSSSLSSFSSSSALYGPSGSSSSVSSGAGDDEHSDEQSPPTSILCCFMRHGASRRRSRRCPPVMVAKKTLFSIVGHRSGHGNKAP